MVAATALIALTAVSTPTAASAAVDYNQCYAGDLTVETWKDAKNVVMFTSDPASEKLAKDRGFAPTGVAFSAFKANPNNWRYTPATQIYNAASKNVTYAKWAGEIDAAVKNLGYTNEGTPFYSSTVPMANCGTQVELTRLGKGAYHSITANATELAALKAQGWTGNDYIWYAPAAKSKYAQPPVAPADADGKFAMAIYPDTQTEVYADAYTRLLKRSQWVADNAKALDIRGVMHTGDVVNWDDAMDPYNWTTANHPQYEFAVKGLQPIIDSGLPLSMSIGNHDTMATGGGNGGSARDTRKTYEYQRITQSFNYYLDQAEKIPGWTAFEAGKVDNGYYTMEAAGAKWLILNMELWPRETALQWAKGVIASHPNYNVMIQSHNIFNGSCSIDGAGTDAQKWQYGDASPQRLWNQLVEPFSNVKVVTSGHTGVQCAQLFTTKAGNKVVGTLQNDANATDNWVRLLEIDVANGTAKTWEYSSLRSLSANEKVFTGLSFLKK